MRDYCLTHKFQEKLGGLQNILVDDKFKIMYCAIAKVGSSAFKTVLAELHNKTFPPGSPHVSSTTSLMVSFLRVSFISSERLGSIVLSKGRKSVLPNF